MDGQIETSLHLLTNHCMDLDYIAGNIKQI